ncbi:guanylate kinase [Campylobacter geochelonis]|uniref:Guanylate kinase n=1 Tax=Campylobacter geochelonis TaxID=1780362 RepID=A0A128EEM1_9BACT|nr:guanylate kinase [Campylobacter geochelonis]QKF70802.1 deoxyguanylate kinase / guanylate kinase [Campylobacter geochelonis]CZE47370.1 guanylate kinase [Campylobacter geochelonis]CZE48103.1 guanylate kinase [Campylobacter geochelonis]CZE50571.1 guanylate kinase [Campylobacter geochelonis]
MTKGQILVISGPSGSGKSTLVNRLMQEESDIYFSISSTTRAIRDGEKDGVNYHYISVDEFKDGILNDEFLEWAMVHKNYYGTSIKPVLEALESGKTVIFDIDVQGFNIVKDKFKDEITSVFITTTNCVELRNRLVNRATDEPKVIERRIMNAIGEMEHIKAYDYFLINDDLEKSYRGFKAIYESMKFKTASINLRDVIESWIN